MRKILEQEGISGISDPANKIRIYVETPEDLVKVPQEISVAGVSVPVEPIVSGRFFALQDRKTKWRPAVGGISLGNFNITAGTLSTRVFDKATKARLILSNAHVLVNLTDPNAEVRIAQPGKYDNPDVLANYIATLERFVQIIGPPEENLVDCALARPLNDADLSDEILDIGIVTGIESVAIGMPVEKSGRTTGYNQGTVQDINATIKVYGYPTPEGYALFKDQIITDAMASGGDSGSLLVNKNTKNAVGLLFAGSDSLTAHCKITNVCDLLNIEFAPAPPPMVLASIPAILIAFMAAGMIPGIIRGE